MTDSIGILLSEIKEHIAQHDEYLKSREPLRKHKSVSELMEYLSNGIQNMRYLTKERQSENKVINLMEYKNERNKRNNNP